jgi:hypothetical protein
VDDDEDRGQHQHGGEREEAERNPHDEIDDAEGNEADGVVGVDTGAGRVRLERHGRHDVPLQRWRARHPPESFLGRMLA